MKDNLTLEGMGSTADAEAWLQAQLAARRAGQWELWAILALVLLAGACMAALGLSTNYTV